MIINPIIPIWLMAIICIAFLIFKKRGIANYIRQILIVTLIFVINLRIMIPNDNVETVAPNVDILFVVDNTISILAEDYNGNERRIDAVREHCRYIMDKFEGASFSVVSFANNVDKLTPYTVDTNMISDVLNILEGESQYYAKGSSFNEVLEELGKILNDDREYPKLVFFISDGEIIKGDALKSFSKLKDYVYDGAVLGYGTKEGGAMKVVGFSSDEEPEYLYYYNDDFDEVKAISKIDESNLKSIAKDLGVDYIHVTNQNSIEDKVDKLVKEVKSFSSKDMNEDEEDKYGYNDIYYIFVIPLIVLLVVDYIYYRKRT